MAEFKVRTKGNADPHGKSRVYFCCHPEDFDRYFEKICEDIFKTHDPAIYYTADMTEPLDEANIEVDLGRMNLFLVPITFRLMNEPCRAMQVDISYAKEHNIPILPFMMEPNLDTIYSLPKNFGERQYLTPFSSDVTEISYEEKLKKILGAILISDEMAKRVRAEFDAHIFLSYRKKDRAYANQLMRIIHKIDGCRDIAIWYDEFLTPGESFIQNIEKAMSESKLFALLVTPHILEDGNFVMREEYPKAKEIGMKILPTEAEETDRDELYAKFDGIPDPIKTDDDDFADSLLSIIQKIAISENDDDPEHNFLIGLAYLEGIDVEVDVERGLALITSAAEADLPEAMEKLYDMYLNGDKVRIDYTEALKWEERLADFYTKEYGEEHHDTLKAYNNSAAICIKLGKPEKALDILKKICLILCSRFKKEHINTLYALNNLALTYCELEEYKKALEIQEEIYITSCRVYGEDSPYSLSFLSNLAYIYGKLKENKKALELKELAYRIQCKVLGEKHPDTLASLNNIAYSYGESGNFKKALELGKMVYSLMCEVLGAKHPNTLISLKNLADIYSKLLYHNESIELFEKVLNVQIEIIGERHPDTINTMVQLVLVCDKCKKYRKALPLAKKAYFLCIKIYGEKDKVTCYAKTLYDYIRKMVK